jgi:hypothetical protein
MAIMGSMMVKPRLALMVLTDRRAGWWTWRSGAEALGRRIHLRPGNANVTRRGSLERIVDDAVGNGVGHLFMRPAGGLHGAGDGASRPQELRRPVDGAHRRIVPVEPVEELHLVPRQLRGLGGVPAVPAAH